MSQEYQDKHNTSNIGRYAENDAEEIAKTL